MMGIESMLSNMLGIDVEELKQQAMQAAGEAKQLVDHMVSELKQVKSLCEDIKTQNELIMEKLGIEIPDDKPEEQSAIPSNVAFFRTGNNGQ